MKKTIKLTLTSLLSLMLLLCIVSCSATDAAALWNDAIYTEDAVLGEGEKTAVVEYVIGEKKITFTILTDAEMLGAALSENSLIEGEDGLYTKVNGVLADYNVDGSYWAFYIDGEYAMTGVDDTPIAEGSVYRLERSK